MQKTVLVEIIKSICENFADDILIGVEESSEDFPFTIACTNFIAELKNRGIEFTIKMLTENTDIFDYLYKEFSNYLAR